VALEGLSVNSFIATLATWCAPWHEAYSNSKALEIGVMSTHLVAMLLGGGIAVAADRDNLRTMREEPGECPHVLDHMHGTHRPVLIGLLFLLLSGVALAAADIETFAKSPVFIAKLTLVILLCVNGLFLSRSEHLLRRRVFEESRWPESSASTPAICRRLRVGSWMSLILWTATAIVGVALSNV
jgi:hypothetical protein